MERTATESLDELLMRVLSRPEQEWPDLLAALRDEDPDRADEAEERLGALRDMGLLQRGGLGASFHHPERLGEFRLLEVLGSGGMGVVYLAEQDRLQRRVALKLIRPDLLYFPGSHERFLREVQAIARLNHPAIVPVHTFGEEAGIPYFAMELVEGANLARALRGCSQSPAPRTGSDLLSEVCRLADRQHAPGERSGAIGGTWSETGVRILLEVADAVAHAHERGVIHRDIKPSNIMLTPEGRVQLFDFGIASTGQDRRVTKTGAQAGSLPYMSPEQLRGEPGAIDGRTDVYSLGVTLFEFLTGRLPFDPTTASDEELRRLILTQPAPDPSRLDPSLHADLTAILLRALEKDPAHRYQSVPELAADLGAFLDYRPIQARRASGIERVRRWARREPLRAGLVASLALGVPLMLGLSGYILANTQEIDEGRYLLHQRELQAHLSRGLHEINHGSAARALREFEAALRLEPGHIDAITGKTIALERVANREEALVWLGAHNAPALLPLGDWLSDQLDSEQEAKAMRKSMPEGDTPFRYLVSGMIAMQDGHTGDEAGYTAACQLLHQAALTTARPEQHRYYLLAHAAGHAGDENLQLSSVAALEALWPGTDATLRATVLAFHESDPPRAAAAARGLLERDDEDVWATHNLGVALENNRDFESAIEFYERAIALDPLHAQAHFGMGRCMNSLRRYDEAIAAYRATIALKPELAGPHGHLGRTLQNKRDLRGAISAYRTFTQLRPDYAETYYHLGVTLAMSGRHDDAIKALREAVAKGFDEARAHVYLGNSLRRAGDPHAAQAAYERAVEVAPRDPIPRFNLAVLLRDRGKLEEVVDVLRAIVKIKPDDGPTYYQLGHTLQRLRRDLEAIEPYRKCIELIPNDGKAYCNLGNLLVSIGRAREGLDYLRRGHEVGMKQESWRYDSARWIKEAEAAVVEEASASGLIAGERKERDAKEALRAALLCYRQRSWRRCFELYERALAADPDLARQRALPPRYFAACAAAHAADRSEIGDVEKARLVKRARELLALELATWRKLTAKRRQRTLSAVRTRLREWRAEPALRRLRGDALAGLEPEEARRWVDLWSEVDRTLSHIDLDLGRAR